MIRLDKLVLRYVQSVLKILLKMLFISIFKSLEAL